MKTIIYSILLLLQFSLLQAASFYVSPDGKDSNEGTIERPFASVFAAREAIRAIEPANRDKDIRVYIRGGNYVLDKTFVLGRGDGAEEDARITYCAYQQEKPVFSSNINITGWKKLSDYPSNTPQVAKGNLYFVDLPEVKSGELFFKVLYKNGKLLPRARSKTISLFSKPEGFEGKWLPNQMCAIRGLDLGALANFKDMDLHVTPTHQWAFNILPLEGVYPQHNALKLSVPATYPLLNCGTVSDGAWLENAINFMDQPGSWCLSREQGRLYYWPVEGQPGADIIAPRLKEYFKIEGDIDIWGNDIPVKNITIQGLTFVRGDRDVLGEKDAAMQHDWDLCDKANALVRLRGAENCEVIDCQISDTAGVGLRLDLYCQQNKIIGNVIRDTGWSGLVLGGYGPGTKDVNHHNLIKNNHIHHIGLLYRTAIGIHLFQSGDNHISNNLVHNTAQYGVTLSCSWFHFWNQADQREVTRTVRRSEVKAYLDINLPRFRKSLKTPASQRQNMDWAKGFEFKHSRNNLIERNEIFNVMERLSEGNCFYVAGVGVDNVIRENFMHSSHVLNGQFAPMRCDDHTWQTTYARNVVWNVGGYGIEGKHVNDYIDNIFYDVVKGVGRYPGSFIALLRQNYDNRLSGNIFYRITPHGMTDDRFKFYKERHGNWSGILTDQLEVDRNCYFIQSNRARTRELFSEQQEKNIDKHSICADPMFEDPENLNFSLKPDSPLLKLGYKSIDMAKIGLEGKYKKQIVNTIRTKIFPGGGHLKEGEKVSLSCDKENADIYYTIDGTDPTRGSLSYSSPFEIDDDCIVRARSYISGENDFYAAIRPFTVEKPKDFFEDFESYQMGMPPLRFEVSGSVETVKRSAAGGDLCIAMRDDSAQPHRWDPHIHINQLGVKTPKVHLSFDIKVLEAVVMNVGFRKWVDKMIEGPQLKIDNGRVTPTGGKTVEMPIGEWLTVDMLIHLKRGKYDLMIKQAGEIISAQKGLEFDDKFDEISWVGWSSYSAGSSVYYLDNILFETNE